MKNAKDYESLKELLFNREVQAIEDYEKKYEAFNKHQRETGYASEIEMKEMNEAEKVRDAIFEIIENAGLTDELIDFA